MSTAVDVEEEGIFRADVVRSAKNFVFRTICSANIGAMFYVFALTVNDSLFKASAIFLVVTYLSMFNYWRKFLGPIAVPLFLFALARWLDIDFAAEFARFK